MKATLLGLAVLTALALMPGSAGAATCSNHSTQAAAQAAADTVDADHDGIYCESLPCPCSAGSGSTSPPPPPPPPPPSTSTSGANPAGCTRPKSAQRLLFSKAKYPNIYTHFTRAVAKGWPRIMVVNRKGTAQRRDRLLAALPTKPGYDRDEYPAAVGRGRANGASPGLVRGIEPIGWRADVEYVPSSENRSHGSSLGAKLRKLCNGTRFRYAFS
jgi:hypothetical protein